MGMQSNDTSPSRNQHMNGSAKPGKVSAPSGSVTLGKAPEPGVTGHKPGSSVKGFDGGMKPGKVKV